MPPALHPSIAAAQAARPGAFDGTWNVTFTPKAGNCHASNTVPFNVYGPRVSSAGGGKVTGGVTRKGDVTVRITVGASWADGRGRLAGNSGTGRWSGYHYRRSLQRDLAGEPEFSRLPGRGAAFVALRRSAG